ncbi:MAG TPA: DUF481 domain-containing protein [Thermomonas sp.]|nr:DUF481 domain-containing protein [Thermomonas sp.]
MKRVALRALMVAVLLGSGPLHADTLVGRNGDRISGRVVEQANGRIVFISDMFGRLEVSSDEAHVEFDASDAIDAAALPSAAQPVQAASVAAPGASPRWAMDLGAKLNLDRGSLKTSEDRLDARLTAVRRTQRGEWHGNLGYKFKKTEGELRDNDWQASLAYDRFVSEHRFNAARVLLVNELADGGYDATATATLATGWRLWEAPTHYLRIGPAVGYLAVTRGDDRFSGAALGLYARGMTPLHWKATLTGELQFLDSLGKGRYGGAAVRLSRPLSEHLVLSLGWDYAWTDLDLESGVTSVWRWDIAWRFGPGIDD